MGTFIARAGRWVFFGETGSATWKGLFGLAGDLLATVAGVTSHARTSDSTKNDALLKLEGNHCTSFVSISVQLFGEIRVT